MNMNTKKCAILQFSRQVCHTPSSYFLDGSIIPSVDKHMDLGITIDKQLKFHDHIHDVAHKANALASNFLKLKSTVSSSPEFMLFLWKMHIRPVIEYGSCIWNTGYISDISLLEQVLLFIDVPMMLGSVFWD